MRPPMNMTPDETEIWQRMEQHGEELVRDMGAALLDAEASIQRTSSASPLRHLW